MSINFENDGRTRIAVVGGGAAGMMAAISAAESGGEVILFEKKDRTGLKLGITGKGRCNVTNDCDVNEFLLNVPRNSRFLYASLNRFSTQDTKDFFEGCGVPLKVERGKRVFPASDKASDIVRALRRRMEQAGVRVICDRVSALLHTDGHITGVKSSLGMTECDSVIIAAGGLSYPVTGSDGDGYMLAEQVGHSIVEPTPSLVPLLSRSHMCRDMQGLSLRNVKFSVFTKENDKKIYEDFGEMMFTHFGVTGPIVLSASSHLSDISEGRYYAEIDFKPALSDEELDARLRSDFSKNINRDFINSLDALLPQKAIESIVEASCIDGRKKVNSITKEERASLRTALKHFRIDISGTRPIEEAIVTRGGVCVKEISPKTMESRLCRGLFFAGEVLDLDAYTGGFNLQIAFSTGVLAGENAAIKS